MFKNIGAFELLIILVFVFSLPALAGYIASKKGRSFWGFFLLCFIITPFIGIIVALIVSPYTPSQQIIINQGQQEPIVISNTVLDQVTLIERLATLKSKGLITEEEFEKEKLKIL